MSHVTIIPKISRDAENLIITNANDSSCLALCQVSKLAQDRLSNGFFQERFFKNYPLFKIVESNIFKTLRADHPNSCWKIACDFFCFHSLNSRNKSMSIAYIQNHLRFICQSQQLQITLHEFNIKKALEEIGCQDPSSPLHFLHQIFVGCQTKGSMETMKTICNNEAVEICGRKFMVSPEETKNLELTIDKLFLIADHANNFNISKAFIDHVGQYDDSIPHVCEPYQSEIEKGFEFALNMKDSLMTPSKFENCLKNIQAAVDKDCSASILEAIDALGDGDFFDDFKQDDAAKEALKTKEGRTQFLKKYEPILLDTINCYLSFSLGRSS